MTTWCSGICNHKSVYHLSVVCDVRVDYSGGWTFASISLLFCTLAILWSPCKILRRLSQGNPSIGGVKRKSGSKIDRCRIRVSHLLTSFLLVYNCGATRRDATLSYDKHVSNVVRACNFHIRALRHIRPLLTLEAVSYTHLTLPTNREV